MRCLIVEDDRLVAERWRLELLGRGMISQLAHSRAEGEASLRAERFGMMLTDLGLPDGARTDLALAELFNLNDNVTAFFHKSENFEEVAALVDHYRHRRPDPLAEA